MAKNVFRPYEIVQSKERVQIEPPNMLMPKEELEEIQEVAEYTGPSADDLRREAELFRLQWEKEKEAMVSSARAEAERIVKEAEQTAFEIVRKKNEEAALIRRNAEEEAEQIVEDARRKAEDILNEARIRAATEESEIRKKAYEEGREEGWKEGKAEVERVIERLHVVLTRAIEKRNEIITQSEAQIVHLILQIARKVVKVISENQKNIVINNVIQALRKLKNKSDVTIRVNLKDLNMVTEHAKEIVDLIETVKSITVLEDASVDPGGCIIETDFGEIDARIATQLQEIEDRILQIAPIPDRPKDSDG
ncbi:MAG TPA: flagellar assembly protein FliH [Spirochaetales bacterium]|nr:flagellar assembly protein FliH [Spirochaetales bacterium]